MKERLNLNMKTHVSKFSNIQFVAFLKGSFILGSAMLVLIVSKKEEFLTSLSIFFMVKVLFILLYCDNKIWMLQRLL